MEFSKEARKNFRFSELSLVSFLLITIFLFHARAEPVTLQIDPVAAEILAETLNNSMLAYEDSIIIANLSAKEINVLTKIPAVQNIEEIPTFRVLLKDTAGILNASALWRLQENRINITGIGETICVLDTGINFSHPSLIGKNATCIIDCFNKECVPDCSLSDPNGHGTHVAGIIAASGAITGLAPNSRLIGLRVLDYEGTSSPTGTLDIKRAIDWCVANQNSFNISVISMSLGTTEILFSDYCDSDFSATITPAVNNAVLHGIAVTAASGNSGPSPRSTTSISGPACINNVTAVSATDKDDSIAPYAHYNSLVDFFAPGTNVNSTYKTGYQLSSGTSASTPHIAALFSLLSQFYKLQNNQTISPDQAQSILKQNGKIISTPTGLNIPRPNILNSLISLDSRSPTVSLNSPIKEQSGQGHDVSLECNSTDFFLSNISFFIWNSTSLYNRTTFSATNSFSAANLELTNLTTGEYKFNCQVTDANNNYAFAPSNISFSINAVSTTLISPTNFLHTNHNQTFSCSATATTSLSNVTFFVWGQDSLLYSANRSITGTTATSNFSYNFSDEREYEWNCLFTDNKSNMQFAEINFSVIFDLTPPEFVSVLPANNSYHNGNFLALLSENGSCAYSLTKGKQNFSMNSSDKLNFFAANSSLIQNKQYNISFFCADEANNPATAQNSFTFDGIAPTINFNSPSQNETFTGASTIDFSFTVIDNHNISTCFVSISGTEDKVSESVSATTNASTSVSVSLSPGQYFAHVNCTDDASNTNISETRNLIILPSPQSPPRSGSGGSGGGSSLRAGNSPTLAQLIKGFSQSAGIGAQTKFSLLTTKDSHTIIINSSTENEVTFIIRSDPQIATLKIGEKKKFNLSSSDYLDFEITLNDIKQQKINFTIKAILEPIQKEFLSAEQNKTEPKFTAQSQNNQDEVLNPSQPLPKKSSIPISFVLVACILIILLIYNLFTRSHKKSTERGRTTHRGI